MVLTSFDLADHFRASNIQVLLSVHNKAVDALFTAESAYREELERRRMLIPLGEAMEIARRGYEVILQRLKALPQNMAPRCNPTDPNRAMTVLESECTAILGDAQKVYVSWSNEQRSASLSPQFETQLLTRVAVDQSQASLGGTIQVSPPE